MSTSHSPLSAFFSAYAGFQYNPSRSPEAEFQRLRRHLEQRNEHWKIEGALSDYKNAVTKQFNAIYGTDVNDIESWHRLCAALRIYPIPEGLEACREIVRATHVNIVDLVHSEGRSAVTIFSSEKKLSEYTIENKKYFPRDNAYAGGILRYLLRQIENPSRGTNTSARRGRGRRGKPHA